MDLGVEEECSNCQINTPAREASQGWGPEYLERNPSSLCSRKWCREQSWLEFPSCEEAPDENFLFIYFFIHEKELDFSDTSPHHCLPRQIFPPPEEVLYLAFCFSWKKNPWGLEATTDLFIILTESRRWRQRPGDWTIWVLISINAMREECSLPTAAPRGESTWAGWEKRETQREIE